MFKQLSDVNGHKSPHWYKNDYIKLSFDMTVENVSKKMILRNVSLLGIDFEIAPVAGKAVGGTFQAQGTNVGKALDTSMT